MIINIDSPEVGQMRTGLKAMAAVVLGLLVACGGGENQTPDAGADAGVDVDAGTDAGTQEAPEVYEFTQRGGTASSVAYGGQVLRQVLIEDLKADIAAVGKAIDDGTYAPVAGEVTARLDFYFRFDGQTAGDVPLLLSPSPARLQDTYGALGNANLVSKLAGNDEPAKQHRDWSTGLQGFAGASSPEALVSFIFAQLDALAVDRANGIIPMGPDGKAIPVVYVTEDGLDLRELLQKFLGGAVNFSQGADDYLDEGLDVDHAGLVAGKPYSALEHHWDEGFGYFGAARDYLLRTDAEVSAAPAHDTNGDGKIDLLSEYSFGHSANASKRDKGSAATAKTDFSGEAMQAFLEGRALLARTTAALTPAERAKLDDARDRAVAAWEKAIAASAVHYINDVLRDMGKAGTAGYKFVDHAKHWSELKGFALSLQFNPRSPLSASAFGSLHQKLGDRPVLPGHVGFEVYKTALVEARTILKDAYGFADANMGDAAGVGGW
jgi:hypothetical protein